MHRTPHSRGSHPFLGTMALGALLCIVLIECSRTHRRRREENPAALPERLQTWEGEGGQNQMGVRPEEG